MLTYFSRGKGPVTEDFLTSCLGDVFAWWPGEGLLRGIAARAERAAPSPVAPATGLPLPAYDGLKVDLWPSWSPDGIPDLVVDLLQGTATVTRLVIEAKFGAGKSGTDAPGEGLAGTKEPMGSDPASRLLSKDQLARYYRYAVRTCPEVRVLYLTHHACAPRGDLEASLKAMRREHPNEDPALFWCSWRDVEQELREQAGIRREPAYRYVVLALADVLKRNGQYHFSGTWPTRVLAKHSGSFYQANPVQ
jgi:hypothetical protein